MIERNSQGIGSIRGQVGGLNDPRSLATKVSRGFTRETMALYPRFVNIAPIPVKPPAHPWECDFTGTNKIRVNDGSVLTPRQVTANDITSFVYEPVEYTSAEVTVTGTGYIYAQLECTPDNWKTDWPDLELTGGGPITPITHSFKVTTVTVVFSADAPSVYTPGAGYFLILPIAEVSLDTGVAFVDKQILSKNPIINIDYTYF